MCFPSFHQTDVDKIILDAKKRFVSGSNLQVPKAIPLPRGRQLKNAGKRRKGWYECGLDASKRSSYQFLLCELEEHVTQDCSLRQMFYDARLQISILCTLYRPPVSLE